LFRLPRIAGFAKFFAGKAVLIQGSRAFQSRSSKPGTEGKDANCAPFAVLWED
jgi:hypothetical protein